MTQGHELRQGNDGGKGGRGWRGLKWRENETTVIAQSIKYIKNNAGNICQIQAKESN